MVLHNVVLYNRCYRTVVCVETVSDSVLWDLDSSAELGTTSNNTPLTSEYTM